MMKSGEVDPKTHFGGPLSRHGQGIGTAPHAADGKPVDGFWNDVREDTMWNPDSDVSQAGQAIGAINDVPPAAFLVKTMMEELVATLQGMGKVRSLPPTQRENQLNPKPRHTYSTPCVLVLASVLVKRLPLSLRWFLSSSLSDKLTLVHSVQVGSQVPDGAKFDIEVPADQPLTLANL